MQIFTKNLAQSSQTNLIPIKKSQQLYGYGERIFRLMALRGIVSNLFERSLLWLYECCIQRTLRPALFDPTRELKGERALQNMGGVLFDLKPEDGLAKLI